MMAANAAPDQKAPDICARCGAGFGCGMLAGKERCWCMDMPVLDPLPKEYEGCLCPACLKVQLSESAQRKQQDDNSAASETFPK